MGKQLSNSAPDAHEEDSKNAWKLLKKSFYNVHKLLRVFGFTAGDFDSTGRVSFMFLFLYLCYFCDSFSCVVCHVYDTQEWIEEFASDWGRHVAAEETAKNVYDVNTVNKLQQVLGGYQPVKKQKNVNDAVVSIGKKRRRMNSNNNNNNDNNINYKNSNHNFNNFGHNGDFVNDDEEDDDDDDINLDGVENLANVVNVPNGRVRANIHNVRNDRNDANGRNGRNGRNDVNVARIGNGANVRSVRSGRSGRNVQNGSNGRKVANVSGISSMGSVANNVNGVNVANISGFNMPNFSFAMSNNANLNPNGFGASSNLGQQASNNKFNGMQRQVSLQQLPKMPIPDKSFL